MQTIRQRLHALLLLAALTISLSWTPRSGTTPTYKTSTTPVL